MSLQQRFSCADWSPRFCNSDTYFSSVLLILKLVYITGWLQYFLFIQQVSRINLVLDAQLNKFSWSDEAFFFLPFKGLIALNVLGNEEASLQQLQRFFLYLHIVGAENMGFNFSKFYKDLPTHHFWSCSSKNPSSITCMPLVFHFRMLADFWAAWTNTLLYSGGRFSLLPTWLL